MINKYQDLGQLHFINRALNLIGYMLVVGLAIGAKTDIQTLAIFTLSSFGVSTCVMGKVFYFDHKRKVHMSNWFVGDPTVPKSFEEPALQAAIKASRRFRSYVPLAIMFSSLWIYHCPYPELLPYAIVAGMQLVFITAAVPYALYTRNSAVKRLDELSNEVTLSYV